MTRYICTLLALCIAWGCTDDVDGNQNTEIHVVVQETNQPCPPACTMCAEGETLFSMEVTRDCSGLVATIGVCSLGEVCQAQLDAVSELVRTCMEESSEFDLDVTECSSE